MHSTEMVGTHTERYLSICIPIALVFLIFIFLLVGTLGTRDVVAPKYSDQITESCLYETRWPNHCEALRDNWNKQYCDTLNKQSNLLLLIPFRNRERQLTEFKKYMDEYLAKATDVADWRYLIAEQLPNKDDSFNRGAVSNAGVWEFFLHQPKQDADFFPNWLCIHDVDGLPQWPTSYRARELPVHLSSEFDKYGHTYPYPSYSGGITCMSPKHFVRINGFSNEFFGWGGEDDDLYWRLRMNNYLCYNTNKGEYNKKPKDKLVPLRPPKGHGVFKSLSHGHFQNKVIFNKTARMNHQLDVEYWKMDGLSNMEYSVENSKVLLAERFWKVSVILNKTSVANAKPYPRWPWRDTQNSE